MLTYLESLLKFWTVIKDVLNENARKIWRVLKKWNNPDCKGVETKLLA